MNTLTNRLNKATPQTLHKWNELSSNQRIEKPNNMRKGANKYIPKRSSQPKLLSKHLFITEGVRKRREHLYELMRIHGLSKNGQNMIFESDIELEKGFDMFKSTFMRSGPELHRCRTACDQAGRTKIAKMVWDKMFSREQKNRWAIEALRNGTSFSVRDIKTHL